MSSLFRFIPMQSVAESSQLPDPHWLWHGFVARMYATLLTSDGKLGKTTLLNGLLQRFGNGTPFLGREVKPTNVLVVSEDPIDVWQSRRRLLPVEGNVELLARPFPKNPDPMQWADLYRHLHDRVTREGFQLVVFDSLASLLPSIQSQYREDAFDAVAPLVRLTFAGAGVLALVNTRKSNDTVKLLLEEPLDPMNPFRLTINLRKYGDFGTNPTWRRIVSRSLFVATQGALSYEWNPVSGQFRLVRDPIGERTRDYRRKIRQILVEHPESLTIETILHHWPDETLPPRKSIDEYLHRAMNQKRVRREGKGVKGDPYRYLLADSDEGEDEQDAEAGVESQPEVEMQAIMPERDAPVVEMGA